FMKYLYLPAVLLLLFLNSKAKEAYIENKGQITNVNRVPNAAVLYLYNGEGLNVQLRKTGFSYDVWKNTSGSIITFNRVDLEFVNMNPAMRTLTSGRSNDYLNYYTEYTGAKG